MVSPIAVCNCQDTPISLLEQYSHLVANLKELQFLGLASIPTAALADQTDAPATDRGRKARCSLEPWASLRSHAPEEGLLTACKGTSQLFG
jgi:hypothetical protein